MTTRDHSVRVVRATRTHLDALTSLFAAYLVFYHRQHAPERVREFLSDRLTRRESVIFVALQGAGARTVAVGFVQLYPSFSSLRLSRMWVLNDLYTVPEARRRGVGHLLIAAARTMAVASSATHLELLTRRDNHAARRVYESAGFCLDDEFCRYGHDLVRRDEPLFSG
jgi:ribosomal protein S18 acetylase RimI-like enzyme